MMGDVWARQDLLVGAPEDTSCMSRDVDVGDLLSGLSSGRGEGVEAFLIGSDWVAFIAYATGTFMEITNLVCWEEMSFLG